MDMEQVRDCLELVRLEAESKPVGDWLVAGAKQDLSGLQRDHVAKVVRKGTGG